MSEIRDRLARAMYRRTHEEPWDHCDQVVQEIYLGDAGAVLVELREPTEAMIEAGNAHQTDERGDPCPMTAASIWRVMIEAGLKV